MSSVEAVEEIPISVSEAVEEERANSGYVEGEPDMEDEEPRRGGYVFYR